jgi:hypothetical protein
MRVSVVSAPCKGENTRYKVVDVATAISAPPTQTTTNVAPTVAPTLAAAASEPVDDVLEGDATAAELEEEEEGLPLYELTWTRGIALLAFLVAVNFLFALLRQEHFEA